MSNHPSLPLGGVPAFGCIVYVAAVAGGVRARVANLAGIEFTADSERGALAKVVPAFKQRVSQLLAQGDPIPWLEPPAPPESGEQRRFVPVHL